MDAKNKPFVLSLSKHERRGQCTLRQAQGERIKTDHGELVEPKAQGKR